MREVLRGPSSWGAEHNNGQPSVSVVVLAYGAEPLIEECVRALLASTGVRVEVILVDNGCTTGAVERLAGVADVRVIRPGANTGFAGGCNLGARYAKSEYFAFVNGDAVVDAGALRSLVRVACEPDVGLAGASLRLYDRPQLINSAGNPVHYVGLSWAGGLGEPAEKHMAVRDVSVATGAAFLCRRDVWLRLGGFFEPMFAYHEDAELSLRTWQLGLRVVYVPDAVVLHRYEFSRNPLKMYLVERNRLIMVLTLYEWSTLVLLSPALLGFEALILLVAFAQGWGGRKLRGWWWLLRHASEIRRRRAYVQANRVESDAVFARLLTAEFDPGAEAGASVPRLALVASRLYWAFANKMIGMK